MKQFGQTNKEQKEQGLGGKIFKKLGKEYRGGLHKVGGQESSASYEQLFF